MAAGAARCRQVEIVLEELAAVRHCMARANPGDLVVLCVDRHPTVIGELEKIANQAQAGAHSGETAGDPDMQPPETGSAGAGGQPNVSVEHLHVKTFPPQEPRSMPIPLHHP